MKLVCHGVSYHKCPIELRERVALSNEQQRQLLKRIISEKSVSESLILSTCNRTEIYLYSAKDFDTETFAGNAVGRTIAGGAKVWRENQAALFDMEAVWHLFSVACGLDSQMLGENQIISQLKAAYSWSVENKASRFFFHRLLHKAFAASKEVRTETDINCGAVSVSLAAIELARHKISLDGAVVLMIGAGENAALAAKYLKKEGIGKLVIASRTSKSAKELSEQLKAGGGIVLEQIPEILGQADLVISSTASQGYVITAKEAGYVLAQRQRPVLMIDIAVPRDIEPAVGELPGVELYNIDDIDEQIKKNRARRSSQIPKAQVIIDRHTKEFMDWLDSLDTAEVIGELTRRYMDYARRHAGRYHKDFEGKDAHEKLAKFAESLAGKIIYGPLSYLKTSCGSELKGDHLQALELVKKMFLEEGKRRRRPSR